MTVIIPCQFCGDEVERAHHIPKATCFNCKMRKSRERAPDYAEKQKANVMHGFVQHHLHGKQ